MMLSGCTVALLTGKINASAQAVVGSGERALALCLTLAGGMGVWSGLMEILRATGDVDRIGRGLRRILRPLMPGVEDDAAWSAMGLNLAANLLGLGNAATPAGVEAAALLSRGGEAGLRALAMLLVMNNTSLQLLPSTVIALRSAAGAADPADIWWPTLVVSGVSTLVGVALMVLLQGRRKHG